MLRFLLALCYLFVISCATSSSRSSDLASYQFLFEKKLWGGCIAAYHKGGLLYLLSNTKTGGRNVSVYNPGNRLFATVPLSFRAGEKTKSCRELDFTQVMRYADINFIAADDLAAIFNGFHDNPQKLENAINAGPVYFRFDGTWQGKKSAGNIPSERLKNVSSLNDIAKYLNTISQKQAMAMIGPRAKHFEDMMAKAQQQRSRRLAAKQAWENRLSTPLKIGDKICTYHDNQFGYVENIQNNKVKTHVVGSVGAGAGFFFSGLDMQFTYSRIEAIRWFKRDEVAHCNFK